MSTESPKKQASSQAFNAVYISKSSRIMRIMGKYSKNNGKSKKNSRMEYRVKKGNNVWVPIHITILYSGTEENK